MPPPRGGRGRPLRRGTREGREAREARRQEVDPDLVVPAPQDPKSMPAMPSPEGLAWPARSRWERLVLGRPAAEVEPAPPPPETYHPDTVSDGWSTGGLTVRLASVRGDAHRAGGVPRQDDVVAAVHPPTGTLVFAVADGASEAPDSHVGAALACRAAVGEVMRQLGGGQREVDWLRVARAASEQVVRGICGGETPTEAYREEALRRLATTLLAGTVTAPAAPAAPAESVASAESAAPPDEPGLIEILPFGDSSAWLLRDRAFQPLIAGKREGAPAWTLPRVPRAAEPLKAILPPDGVLLVGTDGLGDALGDGTGSVGRTLATHLAAPPRGPAVLAHLLDFSRDTFDDDRTLLAVWPRRRATGTVSPAP